MRRRKSLTRTFAIVSLLTLSALGVSLILLVSQQIRQQAVDEAARTASAYATAGIEQKISAQEWETGKLSEQTLEALRALKTNTTGVRIDNTLLGIRLWSKPGQQLFDSTKGKRGDVATGFPDTARLDNAIQRGMTGAALVTEVDSAPAPSANPTADPTASPTATASAGPSTDTPLANTSSDVRTVLDVYVPARADGQIAGAIEVLLNYDKTTAATGEAIRQVSIMVLGGLVLVWLLLFRNVRNASKRLRQSAVENARLALLDPLTGLPNRRLLSERLERAVDMADIENNHVGLLLLDIDRFKEINDSLGHDRGDMLLITVAERLQQVIRDTDTVARLGGDEFAVLLPTVRGVDDASTLAERVLGVFSEPYEIDGLMLHVEASLGLALLPDHANDVTALMKRADVAMYAAKAARRGMSVYSAAGDLSSPAKLLLLGDLRQAIDAHDQLSMSYQPKLDLQTGEVCGLEALLRWNHPVRGAISPTEFIPLAEQTGLIHSLTHRVLELVLIQLQEWRRDGWDVQVAVNLSALNLAEPDLEERISSMLAQYDVPASLLEFEITESAILADPERAAVTLARIAALGSTIALDDFGTGNTSLSQLRDLPIDTLKIDRTFITDLSENGELLVKVVNDLAHQFHMVVVAEGVEEQDIAVRLRELGCDRAQGFLYARPVPAAELPAVLARLGHVRPSADLSVH